jgi:site-specific DNA-methyltransferase (adenine-specific)
MFGEKMQFDVIIGNPPYQLNVGNTSGNSSKARAIYHDFVSQAKGLEPRFISMVIPSRWMTRSTEGIPESWIDDMIDDKRIRVMHDFPDSSNCFPGVEIKGGVCYFVWSRDYEGKCEYVLHSTSQQVEPITRMDYLNSRGLGIVVRDSQALSILEKIEAQEKDWTSDPSKNFSGLVSPKDFFTNKEVLTSSWSDFETKQSKSKAIKLYVNKAIHKVPFGFIGINQIPKNSDVASVHKVYIPAAAWGIARDFDDPVLGQPFYGEPNSVCSQTYLVIGFDQSNQIITKEMCSNIMSYISTCFFRYLVSLKKQTQNGPRGVYQFVPLQDFSKSWTDQKLYKKYGLTTDEIAFIERKIRPMELDNE